MTTSNYFIYVRKSTDDGTHQQLTIEMQLHEVREFARRLKLNIVETFQEHRSAKVLGRPCFQEMVRRIKAGEAQGILAWHPDRLSRNSLDGGELIYLLDTGELKDLKFPHYWFENTPQGKFMLYQAFAQSKFETDTISARVKAAQREKARRGILPTHPPPGYVNDKVTRTIVVDAAQASFVKRAFDLCATGDYSVPHIRHELTAAGFLTKRGKPLSVSKYHFLFNNTFYYGPFRYGGEWWEGSHQPLITKKLFDAVQIALRRQNRKWSKSQKPFDYRGQLYCASCTGMITLEIQKGHRYLRCTKKKGPCSEPYMREEAFEKQVLKTLSDVVLPAPWLTYINSQYKLLRSAVDAQKTLELNHQETSLKQNKHRQEALLDLLLAGTITEADYQAKKHSLILEAAAINSQRKTSSTVSTDRLEPLDELVQRLNKAAELKVSPNTLEIFTFLKLLGSNLLIGERVLRVIWKKPWQLAADLNARVAAGELSPFSQDTNRLLLPLLSTARMDQAQKASPEMP